MFFLSVTKQNLGSQSYLQAPVPSSSSILYNREIVQTQGNAYVEDYDHVQGSLFCLGKATVNKNVAYLHCVCIFLLINYC